MYTLLCNMYSTKFDAGTLKCRKIARRLHGAIMPNVRSLYFLWLQTDACCIVKNIKPWGLGMFSGDVVDSPNAVLKHIFLVASARGRGRGTKVEQELRLLRQAITWAFLYKELPRWMGRENRTPIHIEQLAQTMRDF